MERLSQLWLGRRPAKTGGPTANTKCRCLSSSIGKPLRVELLALAWNGMFGLRLVFVFLTASVGWKHPRPLAVFHMCKALRMKS
jgi:hypothetical protein